MLVPSVTTVNYVASNNYIDMGRLKMDSGRIDITVLETFPSI